MFKTQALCKSCMRIIFGIRQLGTKTTLAVEGVTTESIILELISKKKKQFKNNVDNETLWLFLNIIKKHCDSKFFSLYPIGVLWRHHFEQQLDGAKICKFQLFMLCAYLRNNKQVYFEIIACKTKTIINVWLLIILGNDYIIMTSSG